MQTVCNTYWDAGKGNLTAQNTRKLFSGQGFTPDPAQGTYSAATNALVGGEGLAVPSPRTPSPTLGPSGLASSTPHSKISSDAHVDNSAMIHIIKDERPMSKVEGKTNFSRHLKQCDGLTWLTPTPIILRLIYAAECLWMGWHWVPTWVWNRAGQICYILDELTAFWYCLKHRVVQKVSRLFIYYKFNKVVPKVASD